MRALKWIMSGANFWQILSRNMDNIILKIINCQNLRLKLNWIYHTIPISIPLPGRREIVRSFLSDLWVSSSSCKAVRENQKIRTEEEDCSRCPLLSQQVGLEVDMLLMGDCNIQDTIQDDNFSPIPIFIPTKNSLSNSPVDEAPQRLIKMPMVVDMHSPYVLGGYIPRYCWLVPYSRRYFSLKILVANFP